MSLKTDYKDAVYSGSRKYTITDNGDGTSEIEDVTEYEQTGTQFGAKDINDTNAAVNLLNHVTEVTLSASKWIGDSAPYSQSVECENAKAELDAILVSVLTDGATLDAQKAYNKAFAIISAGTGTIGDGVVTFNVYKIPATTIKVGLRGL